MSTQDTLARSEAPRGAQGESTAGEPGPERHSTFEDAQAIVTACAFFSLGLTLLGSRQLLTGGTPGIALLVSRLTHVRFGWVYLAVNVPFLWLGARRLGWRFTAKTFVAVALLAVATDQLPLVLRLEQAHPLYAALMGGALAGVGLLMLFRHEASLGGIGILALHLQQRFGIRAGLFQLSVDVAILVASLFLAPLGTVALSVLGAAALNFVLAVNHRPGRYMGA